MNVLENKVAIITGGTCGLGFGLAQAYVLAGAKVVVAIRSADSIEKAVWLLRRQRKEKPAWSSVF